MRWESEVKPEGGTEKDKWEEEFFPPHHTGSVHSSQVKPQWIILYFGVESTVWRMMAYFQTPYTIQMHFVWRLWDQLLDCNDLLGSVMENIRHMCCLTWPANMPWWMQLHTLLNLNSSKRPLLIFQVLNSSASCSAFVTAFLPLQADKAQRQDHCNFCRCIISSILMGCTSTWCCVTAALPSTVSTQNYDVLCCCPTLWTSVVHEVH